MLTDGVYIDAKKITLRQLLEIWLAFKKPNVSPRSYERYEELALKNIAPLLGEVFSRNYSRSRFPKPMRKPSQAVAGTGGAVCLP
jgi:Phage integrase, N-terminal SAM-like domain